MADTNVNLIITKKGLEKIAGATMEKPLVIEKFAVGDAKGEEIILDENKTSLANEKYRTYVNDKYSNGNNIVVECVLKANAEILEGFYLRELGLFDSDGDLIVYAKLPEQFRPPFQEGETVTENIFSINLKLANTNNIQISLQENIFATTDSLARLLKRVEKLEADKENLINSSIGIEKWFNTDNKYKDQMLVTIGVKTYALMDSSNILKIADYPILYKNLNAVDRGDGTFVMPNFYDGTTRHLPKGATRELGTFEDDAMQSLDLETKVTVYNAGALTTNVTGNHTHNMWVDYYGWTKHKSILSSEGATRGGWANDFLNWQGNHSHTIPEHGHSASAITTSKAKQSTETRMKNTAGQWYILAKINV